MENKRKGKSSTCEIQRVSAWHPQQISHTRIYPRPLPGKRACRSAVGVCEPGFASTTLAKQVRREDVKTKEPTARAGSFVLAPATGIEPVTNP